MAQDFTTVNAPDGKVINFPASMSQQDITGAMQKLYPSPAQSGPVTPQPGESFAQTMKRGAESGKTVTPKELSDSYHSGIKKIPTVLGASLLAGPAIVGGLATAPEAAGAAAGGGVVGSSVAGATGSTAMELINKALHAASGQNVLTSESAKDVGTAAATGGVVGAGLGFFDKIAQSVLTSKIARNVINASLGATMRDVTYGNPALGIVKSGATNIGTGDLEAYKAAFRTGATPEEAAAAAGGRLGTVTGKINEISPQLNTLLSKSNEVLKVADVIDKPLNDAVAEITANRSMTAAEKDAAVTQLGALQQSLKEGLGDTMTPLQANQIKQALGNRINWAGNIAVTDEVKPVYRAVYGSLKNAVNKAVPGAAQINEDLSDMLAAKTDLEKLMRSEETGLSKWLKGASLSSVVHLGESVIGRILPGAGKLASATASPLVTGPTGATIAEQLRAKGVQLPAAQPNAPALPFNPNAGH